MARGAAPEPTKPEPVTWLELELGDTDIRLQEHPDGMFTLDAPAGEDGRIVLTGEHMAVLAGGMVHLAITKGWLAAPTPAPRRKR